MVEQVPHVEAGRPLVHDNAEHVTIRFVPDDDGQPVRPHAGYLRLWLAEGFLHRSRSWGVDRFPVL